MFGSMNYCSVLLILCVGGIFSNAEERLVRVQPMCSTKGYSALADILTVTVGEKVYSRLTVATPCFADSEKVVLNSTSFADCAQAAGVDGWDSFSLTGDSCELSSFWIPPNHIFAVPRSVTPSTEVYVLDKPSDTPSYSTSDPYIINASFIGNQTIYIDSFTLELGGTSCLVNSANVFFDERLVATGSVSAENGISTSLLGFVNESIADICDLTSVYLTINFVGQTTVEANHKTTFLNKTDFSAIFRWLSPEGNGAKYGFEADLEGNLNQIVMMEVVFDSTDIADAKYPLNNNKSIQVEYVADFSSGCRTVPKVIFSSALGCPIKAYQLERDLCTLRAANESSEIVVPHAYTYDFCSHCMYPPTVMDNSRHCDDIVLNNSATGAKQFGWPRALTALDRKFLDIILPVFQTSVMIDYKNINGTWQWPNGSTELNRTYLDTDPFDNEDSPAAASWECSALYYNRTTDVLSILKVNCSDESVPLLCVLEAAGEFEITPEILD